MQITRRFKMIDDTVPLCAHCGKPVRDQIRTLYNHYGQKEFFCTIECQQESRRSMYDQMR